MSKSGKYLVWENYVALSLNILNMHWLDTNRQVNMMADTYALTHTCHGHQQMHHPDCKTFSSSCLNLSTNKKEKKKPNDWWPTYRPLWQINCYMHVVLNDLYEAIGNWPYWHSQFNCTHKITLNCSPINNFQVALWRVFQSRQLSATAHTNALTTAIVFVYRWIP